MTNDLRLGYLINASIYAATGVLLFFVACVLAARLWRVDLRAEIVREKNMAVAVLAAAVVLGIALIVSAAVH